MRVNLTGVLHVTHAYLPDMIERGWTADRTAAA